MSDFHIRTASPGDERGIHEAQMRSIREVCSKDYTKEEILGWGNRPLGNRWHVAIKEGHVWVVESAVRIFGCAYLRIVSTEQQKLAYIDVLYLTPEVIGKGLGKALANLMIEKAKEENVKNISLDSTITAHEFYRSLGFSDVGPVKTQEFGASQVKCFPMELMF